MDMEKDINSYKTKDMYEAAALIAAGSNLIDLEPENGHYLFIFLGSDSCRTASDSYWNEELQVPAKALTDAIRSLKDRLFAVKSKENSG